MRAKDMHMKASIYAAERIVFVTGAIDINDIKIKVRIKVPESGIWNVVKAETNLTNEAWSGWKIGLGYKNSIPYASQAPACCQFRTAKYCYEDNSIIFYQGEIRPGEPILKSFSIELEAGCQEICMNHGKRILKSRLDTETADYETIMRAFDDSVYPEIEILIPSKIVDGDFQYSLPDLQPEYLNE